MSVTSAAATPAAATPDAGTARTRIRDCVDVLCDGTGRVGALSYVVPDELEVSLGDAVEVPFGTRMLHGVVVGPGDPQKANRPVLGVWGRRANPVEMQLAARLAERHFSEFSAVAPRLAPRRGRGEPPLTDADLVLAPDPERDTYRREGAPVGCERIAIIRAPLVDPARLAALEAHRLATSTPGAQVLVLCPTVELVGEVCAQFSSGAQRLDKKARPGAWRGFAEGSVRVGVGTRSAALYSASELAGIVVVEEDHPGHVEATQPHWNARDVASTRTLALGIPYVCTAATPTAAGMGARVRVVRAGGIRDWPRMQLLDRRSFEPELRSFPPPLRAALRRAQRAGRTPLVLAQRHKATRRCQSCSEPRPCEECSSSLCPHPALTPCPRCGGVGAWMQGFDAERLTPLVGELGRVVSLAELVESRGAGCVILPEIDLALRTPALNPDALAAGIIVAAATAAGRGGSVLALTADPEQELLRECFEERDLLATARRCWDAARELGLPPFGRLVQITCGQEQPPRTTGWPGRVHGPRRVGREWEVLIRCEEEELELLAPLVSRLRRGGKVRCTVT